MTLLKTRQPRRWRRVEAFGPGHPLAWVIWSVPAIFFLYEFILRIAPSLMLPQLQQEMNLTAGGIGAVLGAYYYAYAPMQLVVGVLLDRFGPRRLLVGATVICVVGLVLGGQATSGSGLVASRVLLGLGSAFAYIGAVYVAMTWFPSNRVAMLTGLTAGVGFGGAIGGEFLLQAAFGTPPSWARGMWVLAIIGLVLTLAIWLAVPEQPAWHLQRIGRKTSPTFKSVMSGLFDVMRNGSTWLVSIGCSFMYLPLAFAGNWGPRDLHVVLGIDPAVAPRVYALFYVGIGLGCPLIGLWSDAVGRRKPFLVWGSVAAAVGTAAMALLPQATSDLVWFILPLWGLVVSTYVLGYPLAVELNRRDAGGTAIAFVNGIGMVVAGLMVWLFGVVIDALAAARGMSTPSEQDLRWGLAMLAGLILLAAVIHLLVREPASMTRGQPRQHP